MALSRVEISRRYRDQRPNKHKESVRRTNENRRIQILKQKEMEALNEILRLSQGQA
jgi:hypothetical protein